MVWLHPLNQRYKDDQSLKKTLNVPTSITQALFLRKAELGFFHFLDRQAGWYLPLVRRSPVDPTTTEDPAC